MKTARAVHNLIMLLGRSRIVLNARDKARGHRRHGDDGDNGDVKPMHRSDSDGKVSGPS